MSHVLPDQAVLRAEQLSAAKRALLRRMLAERHVDENRLVRREDAGGFPLSVTQRRIWLSNQLHPDDSSFNVPLIVRLSPETDLEFLRHSIAAIVARHGAFRTRFEPTPDGARQVADEYAKCPIDVFDLASTADSQRSLVRRQVIRDFVQQPFDLIAGSPCRWGIVTAGRDIELICVMHHIVCDGWSLQLIIRELCDIYGALRCGDALPDAPQFSYGDYVAWQLEHNSAERLEDGLAFWERALGKDPVPLDLPVDYPRNPNMVHGSDTVEDALSSEDVRRIGQLARSVDGTPFMVLLAAWQAFLARYADQSQIRVATPVANRVPSGVESIVGMFVNTLVLEADIDRQRTFRELLADVRQFTVAALQHQQIPFDRVVERLQPQREIGRSPLADTLFAMQNYVTTSTASDGLGVLGIDLGFSTTAGYDLTLNALPVGDSMELLLAFDTNLFDRATAMNLLEAYLTLIRSALDDPDQPIRDLEILNERQKRLILQEWNAPCNRHLLDRRVPDLVLEQAARTPDAIAIRCDDDNMSYARLIADANRVASWLQQREIGVGDRVGVALSRTPFAVAAMVGINMAGAAFLPLDPQLPDERLQFLIDDAMVAAVITNDVIVPRLDVLSCPLLLVDKWDSLSDSTATSGPEGAGYAPTATDRRDMLDDVAYIIYTSGSTGLPKGAELSHRGWVNHATDMARRMRLEPGDCRSQILSLSFDASIEEIFPALITGATLVMHPRPKELSSEEIRRYCQSNDLRQVNLLPVLFEPLVNSLTEADRGWVERLKCVIVGGDRLSPDVAQKWSKFVGNRVRTLFVYGVTEATIANTVYELPEVVPGDRPIPIGKPIANQRAYVVDSHLRLAPLGAIGELCVGGIGVGRGYVNRDELSAEKFVADPFVDADGSRMYRTGDRVRWRHDGTLEFAGRQDHQLKIRGYRIETGEIETALSRHAKVDEAKVIGRRDSRGHLQLVAYLVVRDAKRPTADELRTWLSHGLPAYMIPVAFVFLDNFPLASGGKVNYQALPSPDWQTLAVSDDISLPRTCVEKQLVDIWQKLLNIAPIGIHQNFFELGGDSILTLQLVNEASEVGLHLTPRHLFHHQTICELAAVIQAEGKATTAASMLTESPLTPIQTQFFATNWSNPHHFNQAVVLQADKNCSFDLLRRAWRLVLERHRILLSRFSEDHTTQRYEPSEIDNSELAYIDVTDCSHDNIEAEVDQVATRMQTELNIYDGPVVRASAIALGATGGWRIVIVAHHLVVDGVSWRILIRELQAIYDALETDRAIQLPAVVDDYARFATSRRELATNRNARRRGEIWLNWSSPVSLPVEYVCHANVVQDAARVCKTFDPRLTARLLNAIHKPFRVKVDEFLLSGLCGALSAWYAESGGLSPRLRLDIEQHGRDDEALGRAWSRAVGWFTNLVPVEFELFRGGDPLQRLRQVKDQLRDYLQRGQTFGMLRWLVQDPAFVARFPSGFGSEVSFNYLGKIDETASDTTWLRWSNEKSGASVAAANRRWHVIEFNAFIHQGQLHIEVTYNQQIHARATIERLVGRMFDELLRTISLCEATSTRIWTASDFPLAAINNSDLDSVMSQASGGPLKVSDASKAERITDIRRLTQPQQLMLLHCVTHPNDRTMEQHLSCRLRGELPSELLREAWHEVVQRYSVLRTGFVWEQVSQPYQFVRSQANVDWREVDLTQLFEGGRELALEELLAEYQHEPLSLSHPPLMRVVVARLTEQEWLMQWSCHHLVLDGWSVPIILGDVFRAYEAKTLQLSTLQPARDVFPDYLRWLEEQDEGDAKEYWANVLADYVPCARYRVRHHGTNGWNESRRQLSAELTEQIERRAKDFQVPTTTFFAAAWSLVIAKLHDSRDIVFGVAVSGRPANVIGAAQIVGPMTNTLPVRVRLQHLQDSRSWLKQLHQQLHEMSQYEHVSLSQISQWRGVAEGPLFDSLLVVENYPIDVASIELTNLRVENVQGTATSAFPITVVVVPGATCELRVRGHDSCVSASGLSEILSAFEQSLLHLVRVANGSADSFDWQAPVDLTEQDQGVATSDVVPIEDWGGDCCADVGDQVERELVMVWRELLQIEQVGLHDSFMDLGGDSVQAVNMLAIVEERFGCRLPIAALFNEPTIARFADRIRHPADSSLESLVVPLRAGGAERPLFCIHPAGGTVFCYQHLARYLEGQYPVFGIQAVGLDGARLPQTDIVEMAREYQRAIQHQQPAGPYSICGWSSGGVLAYEVACQLTASGETVDVLMLYDAAIATAEQAFVPDDFLPMLIMMFPGDAPERLRAVQEMAANDQLDFFRQRAELAKVVTDDAGIAQIRAVYEVFKANMQAMTQYRPNPYDGSVHLYRTQSESTPMHRQVSLGWDQYVSDLRVHYVEGDHISMFTEPHVQKLAQRINSVLRLRATE